jgi:hypothetical protein
LWKGVPFFSLFIMLHRKSQPPSGVESEVFSTVMGFRRLDLVLLLALACFVLLRGDKLLAFYSVTVVEVEVAYIASDETRIAMPTPERFQMVPYAAALPTGTTLQVLEKQITGFMRETPLEPPIDKPGRFDWVIRYARNSTVLDQERVLTFAAEEK